VGKSPGNADASSMSQLSTPIALWNMHRRVHAAAWVVSMTLVVVLACDRSSAYALGIVLDLDGLRGATIAMEEINAHGGINGHTLELRSVGGAGSYKASVALETASVLAADPAVLAVIGHTNSSASLAASQVYNAQHVVQLAPTTTAPVYSEAGPYSFRLAGSDVHQGVFVANHVLALTPRPRTAVLFVNDDYGRPLHEIIVSRLRAGSLSPVYDSPYAVSESAADNQEMIEALARAHPQLIVWIGRSADFLRFQPLLRKALPVVEVFGTDGFSGNTLADDTLHLPDAVSYVRLVDMQRPDSGLRRLFARYKREGWHEPSDQAVLAYDAVQLLAEAVRVVGPKREAIRSWLTRLGTDLPPVQGLSGAIAFSPEGDRLPQYFLATVGKARQAPVNGTP